MNNSEVIKIPDIIFLCGFMGAGKSTLGCKLAQQLDCSFLDLDERITEKTGKTIPQIFADSGEGGFRTIERKVLIETARDYKGIVALGGGSLQNQHLLDHLKLSGLLIFIKAPVFLILDRILDDENRPLLLDEHGSRKNREELKNDLTILYEERLPLYEQAVITIEITQEQCIDEQVETLILKIRNHVA